VLTQKLLIVDDQPEIRKMLRISLGYGKYQLFEAADGATALSIARAEKPDVMLLDVMMPGELNGLDVCRAVKQDPLLAHSFVVMLTARGQLEDYVNGDKSGADAYMIKPCTLAKLIEVIEKRTNPGHPIRAYA
jgi:two-component system phosphate regulon response regulator PhoB